MSSWPILLGKKDMTSIKIRPIYEDNKTYPILVKVSGHSIIKEMSGKEVNRWNLSCVECSCTRMHQPCEACPNGTAQWK